ncbi:MAG: cardiolipin synthase [Thiohalocapsa sp.]
MSESTAVATTLVTLHVAIQVALIVRILLRPHRDPASRIAWVVVVVALPVVGIIAYLLLGEVNIGRGRVDRMREVLEQMPPVSAAPGADAPALVPEIPERHAHLFRVGHSISGFEPIGGNRAQLPPDSDAVIDSLVADIDAARDHVHLLFYIWLPDNNGCKVASAMMRAAARGVTCRAMADDLGSRLMIHSEHWSAMGKSGVRLARALRIGNPLLRALGGRIDLRNHRKIVVIDDWITYCGSQNCADPEFVIKAKYAPWVDAMIRFEGPIARQNQHLFAGDWMAQVDDDIDELLRRPMPPTTSGLPAQVVGTGPTVRYSAMPEMFESLIYSARRELTITSPYYVPVESMQAALCASARRGVDTKIVFPARNDSWIVSAASRSYYADLLTAGVRIFEYVGGLLHTKSLTLDGEITLIGSANMDRRSFELNYENNILLYDADLTATVRERQQSYIDSAIAVEPHRVSDWSWQRRLWNNAVAMLGPVL